MVDCRSLIEFCKAFEHHRNNHHHHLLLSNHHSKKPHKALNPLSHPFCNHAPFAAIDAILLLLVLGAITVLTFPYFTFLFSHIFPPILQFITDVIHDAPIPYIIGLILAFCTVIGVWEIFSVQFRKCGNPFCKGLRKAVEFDIQIESEDCVKYLPQLPHSVKALEFELREDYKELEAELRRMAPPNGRTVLIFRARCGCPAGRMEVWGVKKLRRIKK